MIGDDYEAHEDLGGVPPTQGQSQPSHARKPPKAKPPRSNVFVKHFTKVPIENDPNRFYAFCNYCDNKRYAFNKGGGYGTMSRHLQAHHPDVIEGEKASDAVQTHLNFPSGEGVGS